MISQFYQFLRELAPWGLWIWLLLPILSFAQTTSMPHFRHLTIDEGLSSNITNAVLQSQDGFLWIATSEGLSRYDGYSFKKYQYEQESPHTINSNFVGSIYEDHLGRIWFGPSLRGFCRYDKYQDHFVRYDYLIDNFPIFFFEDEALNLWVFGRQEVVVIDPKTDHVSKIPKLSKKSIMAVCSAGEANKFWIGTLKEGLYLFDAQSQTLEAHANGRDGLDYIYPYGIRKMYVDTQGILWLGYHKQGVISTYNPQTKQVIHYKHEESNPKSFCNYSATAFIDWEDKLWIGTENGGILEFDRSSSQFTAFTHDPRNPASLSSNSIAVEQGFYKDRQGRLWVSTHLGGLNILDPYDQKFKGFEMELPDPVVSAIHFDSQNRLWIGTEKGLLKVEGDTSQIYLNAPVLAISEDPKHQIWVATWGKGLNCYLEEEDIFLSYRHQPDNPQSILTDNLFSLAATDQSEIWVGGYGGISHLSSNEDGSFENHSNFMGETGGLVRTIYPQGDKLWIGSTYGLTLFKPTNQNSVTFHHESEDPHSLSGNDVTCILRDSRERLWIGTTDGLNLMQPDSTFLRITSREGLPNNTINSLSFDQHGLLWIATNEGLCRYEPETQKFRTYDHYDGLLSNQFREKANALDSKGRIFLGGMKGVNYFDPKEIQDNPHIPQVYLTDFKIFNKSVRIGEQDSLLSQDIIYTREITLDHTQSVFTLEFVALNFTHPVKNQYAYILEGFDKDWNYVKQKRTATYTNLDPGTYTFRVKASNNDGQWNEQGAQLLIHILPPWWETWWFRTLLIVLILGGIYTYYKTRLKAIQKRNEKLEKTVLERTLELQEVNTEVLTQAEELQQQAEELSTQRDYLEMTNQELEKINVAIKNKEAKLIKTVEQLESSQEKIQKQKRELELKNQQIGQSIQAAQTIQKAILPSQQRLEGIFPEYFIIYRPKDIVSGDFYWHHSVKTSAQNPPIHYLASVDCTGHGIPGAFMTLIGNTLLDKIISQSPGISPGQLLEKLDEEVRTLLKQETGENHYGMDMNLISWVSHQENQNKLTFAGAKSDMYYLRSDQPKLTLLRGSRRSLGGLKSIHTRFEDKELILPVGSIIYMGSDGYIDQNDEARKSLGKRKLEELLQSIYHLPLIEQKIALESYLEQHMKNTNQRDDIMLIGFRV